MSSQWLNLKSESLLEHFGLTREPFNITPDPSFLYLSASHHQALARLLYGINTRKGFIVLTGEVGTGKTTLIHCLLQELKKRNTQSTLIVNTINRSKDLLRDVCEDLGFTAFQEDRQNIHTYLKLLNQLLLESYHKGKNVTLIIDEAQNLSTKVLESIRLLSNFETSEDKLLQIVLAGQPELAARLNTPSLRQLKQRVVLYHNLKPLNFGECAEYIARRLEIAGAVRSIFTSEALQEIYNYSGGLPRLINILCENGMLTAYASGGKRVRAEMIREIAEERALTFHSEETVRLRAVAAGGIEWQERGGPEVAPIKKITRLGRIIDEAVEGEEPVVTPPSESSTDEFMVFTAGATEDAAAPEEPAGAEAREEDVAPPPAAGDPGDEVEAEFRVRPASIREFTVFTAGATTDEPPGVTETTEIEMEREVASPAPADWPLGESDAKAEPNDGRVEESAVEEFAVFTIGETTDAPAAPAETASKLVPPSFFASMIRSLTEAMGPMAPLVVHDQVAMLGERFDAFPGSRLAELVESASREISEAPLRIRFQRAMSDEIDRMNFGKEEK
ncbi:MAG TPA: AAA family ATPase [Candidatus Binatia bacterium]